MSIRSLEARLKRLTPPARPVIGEDVDRDLRRRQELGGRTYVPGLTAAEEAEYAELNASLKKEDEDSGRFCTLPSKILSSPTATASPSRSGNELSWQNSVNAIDPMAC
jgi:hypothetical protein